jgi:predicted site-specific integrase-resolvase
MLVKIKKLYEDLGVTRQTIYNWIKLGKIKTVKSPGGYLYVTQETYDDILKNNLEIEAE